MINLSNITNKISVDKEALSTLPRNNEKNINAYLKKVSTYKTTYQKLENEIIEEMKQRISKINEIEKSEELLNLEDEIKNTEGVIYLLNDIDTSYEKMDLDRILYNLNFYYKKNLEIVNDTILYCIKKFEEVGIKLTLKDFTYSKYVNEYINVFLQELENENINSKRIKSKFEEIYWKCPDIIVHIKLNIIYLYLKNEKYIEIFLYFYGKGERMKIIKNGWDFFQDQILGMHWLKDLIGKLLVKAGLGEGRFPGEFLHFFLYDIIKIFVLLAVLIFVISYIQSYFPPERSRKIMGRFHGIWANLIGALLGTVTPFCSCSSIPIFMGFTSAGLPLGVTFSFLISSPMVDLGSLVLLMSVFGGKIAFAYVIVGLVIAVAGGTIIERMHMEDQVADFIRQASNVEVDSPSLTIADRMDYAKNQVVATVKKVAPYIVVGVIIGAAIHNLIPEHIVRSILGKQTWYAVPLATAVGVPMYADIFGTIPIAESLLAKGAGLGTILSFMMAVTTLSLPSMVMLSKAIKKKLLGTFIGIVCIGIIIVGYGFNMII